MWFEAIQFQAWMPRGVPQEYPWGECGLCLGLPLRGDAEWEGPGKPRSPATLWLRPVVGQEDVEAVLVDQFARHGALLVLKLDHAQASSPGACVTSADATGSRCCTRRRDSRGGTVLGSQRPLGQAPRMCRHCDRFVVVSSTIQPSRHALAEVVRCDEVAARTRSRGEVCDGQPYGAGAPAGWRALAADCGQVWLGTGHRSRRTDGTSMPA